MFKTKMVKYQTKGGEYVVKEQATELMGSNDGRVDLPEWLQYLRRVKQEKIEDMMKHPMLTPSQAIETANTGMDKWFHNMMTDLRMWQEIRREQQREATRKRREQEMIRKTDAVLNTPHLTSKSDMYNLNDTQRETGIKLFKKMDFDKSGVITMDEFEALFEYERAKELSNSIDGDGSGAVGIDEFQNFLRKMKRSAVSDFLSESPEDLDGALESADGVISALYDEILDALKSDSVAEKRRAARKLAEEMHTDAKRLANPLGGFVLPDSPAVQRKKAIIHKVKNNDVKLEYTPARKLVYVPGRASPFEAAGEAPSSVSDWMNKSHKSLVHAETDSAVAKQLVCHSEQTRTEVRRESHQMYMQSTGMINIRVADTSHAQAALYRSLEVCDEAILKTNEASEAVTLIFEHEADALDEILWVKKTRSERPGTEKVYDEATLAIQHREEELDPSNHEIMLGKLDKLRRALRRLQRKLSNDLGNKVISKEVDSEVLNLLPSSDPPEDARREAEQEMDSLHERLNDAVGDEHQALVSRLVEAEKDAEAAQERLKPTEISDGAQLLMLPKDKARVFEQFAKTQILRGTALPFTPTFQDINQAGAAMDVAEYKRFCKEYGLETILDGTTLMAIFHAHCLANKGQLNAKEFTLCATCLENTVQTVQRNWAIPKPAPSPKPAARAASLTVKELASNQVSAPRPVPLFATQALPIVEPVTWKKKIRTLLDETERHSSEAVRMLTKANAFVEEHKQKDMEGRNKIVKALKYKTNKLEDQVMKLNASIAQAHANIESDQAELLEVEMRQDAVEDFLQVAVSRADKRVERPSEEQVPDPAYHALEAEMREAKAELTKLKNDHVRLQLSIEKLQQTIKKLSMEVSHKEAAIELDRECQLRLSVPLVKGGEEQQQLQQ
eukprot:TRINITY_DN1170_c0_g1_i3.p1 TRINITY_DN1170_c0_g1~~TRINITY_DN1170_c0_g1_i3.p1  ORF type:complete len:902 (-),score=319.25 TRINITY_DN1170_c0_g1_i3:398-3103(-)